MLKEKYYHKLAEEYKCNIGICEWDGKLYPHYKTIKSIPEEMKVIVLIQHMVREGIYPQCMKEVLRIEKKYGKRRINKSTIYEKVINTII